MRKSYLSTNGLLSIMTFIHLGTSKSILHYKLANDALKPMLSELATQKLKEIYNYVDSLTFKLVHIIIFSTFQNFSGK